MGFRCCSNKLSLCCVLICFIILLFSGIADASTALERFCEKRLSEGRDALIDVYGELRPCSVYLEKQKAQRSRLVREHLQKERKEKERRQRQIEQARLLQEHLEKERMEKIRYDQEKIEHAMLENTIRKKEQSPKKFKYQKWWWIIAVLMVIVLSGTPLGMLKGVQNWGKAVKANLRK